MDKKPVFSLQDILSILPHRPPFLFVDCVVKFIPHKIIIARRTIQPDEPWFAGHFPQRPIMPGVLVLDALAQASGLLMGFSQKTTSPSAPQAPQLFYLASSQIKFVAPALPHDTLELIAEQKESFNALHSFEVEAIVGRKTIAKGTLMLAGMDSSMPLSISAAQLQPPPPHVDHSRKTL